MQRLGSSCTLQDAFPDEKKPSICSAYFSSSHLTERTWFDFESLATSDDVTFWTVVAHHQQLGSLISSGLSKLDHAQHSTSTPVRRSVKKKQGKALTSVLLRIACDTAECVRRRVGAADLAKKIHMLLPLRQFLVFNASVMQYHHGVLASLAGCAFHLLNPLYLCGYNALMLEWRETVDQIVKRCVKELGRGRYQRQSGDVLLLFEQAYRVVKSLWALLSSCPFVADYLPLEFVLRGLRIMTDVVSPLLQHFLLTCDALNARRELLSKANAGVLNASLSAAILLFLFRSFLVRTTTTTTAVQDETKRRNGSGRDGERRYLRPAFVHQVEDRVRECTEVYLRGFAALLLHRVWEEGRPYNKRREGDGIRRGKKEERAAVAEEGTAFRVVFEALWAPPQPSQSQLEQPTSKGMTEWRVGEILLVLKNPVISDNGDFARVCAKRQRFFELLLAELANQDVHMDHQLLQRGLLTEGETEVLAECQQAVMGVLAGVPFHDASPRPASPSSTAPLHDDAPSEKAAETGAARTIPRPQGEGSASAVTVQSPSPFPPGSLGACVHEVLPHFSVSLIEAALQHYHDDIEHLISDALMDNLPPHLSTALPTSTAAVDPHSTGENEHHALQKALEAAPCSEAEKAMLWGACQDPQEGKQEPLVVWNPDLLLPHAAISMEGSASSHLTNDDFDDALQIRDLSLFFWEMERVPRQKGGPLDGEESAADRRIQEEDEEDDDDDDDDSSSSDRMMDHLLGDATTDYITYHPEEEEADWGWSSNTGKAFHVSEEMKDKIKALAEMMLYEDELDDDRDAEVPLRNLNRPNGASGKGGGQKGTGGHWRKGDEYSEEEEEETDDEADGEGRGMVVGQTNGPAARGSRAGAVHADAAMDDRNGSRPVEMEGVLLPAFLQRPPPRSDYDRKQFRAQRDKERLGYGAKLAAAPGSNEGDFPGADGSKWKKGGHPEKNSENRPAYAKKKKTVKEMHKIREKRKKVVE